MRTTRQQTHTFGIRRIIRATLALRVPVEASLFRITRVTRAARPPASGRLVHMSVVVRRDVLAKYNDQSLSLIIIINEINSHIIAPIFNLNKFKKSSST